MAQAARHFETHELPKEAQLGLSAILHGFQCRGAHEEQLTREVIVQRSEADKTSNANEGKGTCAGGARKRIRNAPAPCSLRLLTGCETHRCLYLTGEGREENGGGAVKRRRQRRRGKRRRKGDEGEGGRRR